MWEKIKKWVFGLKSGILVFGSLKLRHPNNPQPPSSPPKDIKPRNGNGKLHGLCIWYYNNDNISFKQRYVNGECNGIHEWYRSNGELWYKTYKIKDKCIYDEWYGNINQIRFRV